MSGEKDRRRYELQNALRVLSVGERHAMSSRLHQHLFRTEAWARAATLLTYSALPGEPRTVEILQRAVAENKAVCYPKVSGKDRGMSFYRVLDVEELQRGAYGILEPKADPERAVEARDLQLALIPGLGFDRSGNRLGRGMGYYDRFLSRREFTGIKIGCCFSCQIVDSLPTESHDVPIDVLLCEKGAHVLQQ